MTAQKASPSVAVERTDYDMKRLVAPPALSEPELEGRRLVVQRCAYCHDQGPRAPVPGLDAERIKAVGEAGYRDKILKGSRRMPGWQYALSSAQIDQIMAYVKTVTPSQRSSSAAR
jgi:mono/diheme cytochrome c family protein